MLFFVHFKVHVHLQESCISNKRSCSMTTISGTEKKKYTWFHLSIFKAKMNRFWDLMLQSSFWNSKEPIFRNNISKFLHLDLKKVWPTYAAMQCTQLCFSYTSIQANVLNQRSKRRRPASNIGEDFSIPTYKRMRLRKCKSAMDVGHKLKTTQIHF